MDKELDDLLDSALDDFEKEVEIEKKSEEKTTYEQENQGKVTIEKTELYVDDIDYDDRPKSSSQSSRLVASSKTTGSAASSQTKAGAQTSSKEQEDQMKLFDEIFNDAKTRETMKQLTDVLSGFKEGDEAKLIENFGQIMSQLTNETLDLDQDDDELDADMAKNLEGLNFFKNLTSGMPKTTTTTTIKETSIKQDSTSTTITSSEETIESTKPATTMDKVLEDMTKNSEKILSDDSNSAAASFSALFSRLTSSLDDDSTPPEGEEDLEGGAAAASSSTMMEPILSMLFSKDILYPSLKLMLENYDKYIEERKEKLSEEEMKKCLDQKQCIGEMCQVYEAMKDEDGKEAKSESLKKILDLLEKCGMPPNELVPEVNPFDVFENQLKPEGCPIS